MVFYVAIECGQEQRALCHDTTFYVVTGLDRPGVLCLDKVFLGLDRVGQARIFLSQQSMAKWRGSVL